MRRIFRTIFCLLLIEVCGFYSVSNYQESSAPIARMLHADTPDDEDDIDPPDDPIYNSPIQPDSVIFGPYGEPIVVIKR